MQATTGTANADRREGTAALHGIWWMGRLSLWGEDCPTGRLPAPTGEAGPDDSETVVPAHPFATSVDGLRGSVCDCWDASK